MKTRARALAKCLPRRHFDTNLCSGWQRTEWLERQRTFTICGIFVGRLNNTNRNSRPINTDPYSSKCRCLVDFLVPCDEHRWVKRMSTALWSSRNDLKERRVDVLGDCRIEGFPRNGPCPSGDGHNVIGRILETLSRAKLEDKCLCAKPAPFAIRGWRYLRGNLFGQLIHAAQRDHRLVEVDRNPVYRSDFAIWGDTSNCQRAGINSRLLPCWRWRECRRNSRAWSRRRHAVLRCTEGKLIRFVLG